MSKIFPTNPKFITFEGGEGSGKSTQSRMLYEYMLSQNISVIHTREIGGTNVAEKIREIILHNDMSTMTELLMVMAARFEHVERLIKPSIASKKWVICDRFIDSTLSYQGNVLGVEQVLSLHKSIFNSLMPDITFFIDVPYELALSRAISRGDTNKFEAKDMEFHKKTYQIFQMLAQKFNDRIITIDGTLSMSDIHQNIKNSLGI